MLNYLLLSEIVLRGYGGHIAGSTGRWSPSGIYVPEQWSSWVSSLHVDEEHHRLEGLRLQPSNNLHDGECCANAWRPAVSRRNPSHPRMVNCEVILRMVTRFWGDGRSVHSCWNECVEINGETVRWGGSCVITPCNGVKSGDYCGRRKTERTAEAQLSPHRQPKTA